MRTGHFISARGLRAGLAGAACVVVAGAARGQVPVAFTSTTAQFRTVMANGESQYVTIPSTVSMDLAEGPGTVQVRELRITAGWMQCAVPIFGSSTAVVIMDFSMAAASGAGMTMPTTVGSDGQVLFEGTGVEESAAGTATYDATGMACGRLQAAGGVCHGPLTLEAPGSNARGVFAMGSIAPASGGQARAVAFQFRGSFPFTAGSEWGRVDVLANLSGTISGGAPACAADFNGTDGVSVQDIFDFLAAWFAGNARADFNQTGGVTVQDIFDFLSAWFAGC